LRQLESVKKGRERDSKRGIEREGFREGFREGEQIVLRLRKNREL
jgi:hypothetical protein